MISSIPSPINQTRFQLLPITFITRFINPNHMITIVKPSGLNDGAIRNQRSRRTPHVRLNHEWTKRVGNHVVFDRVGRAVLLQYDIVLIFAAFAVG
ncbi:hypothetical protein HanIR_Chr02g0067761 [Helianthus annuus]|nr:hypothetical protein HanIR_Chr02g0067761 [Helianthus annuus]